MDILLVSWLANFTDLQNLLSVINQRDQIGLFLKGVGHKIIMQK